ncbi:hypothetical protein [Solimonas terrae]|uniref:DinB family protein n=1 Tax=Solimonas terrae TaxID=1396819 RepID=A0A6M2BTB2_9GAMM|nr:hypothetical protein [Solimonas terrae]NGY05455.1 hypothetical protein [Solimonas terrae]
MKSRPSFADLIAFNVAVIAQGQRLARHYFEHGDAFRTQVGPHLRHIIEHYEALLNRRAGELVDYDHRARDRSVEQSPIVAARRLDGIVDGLQALRGHQADEAVSVGFSIGVDGAEFHLSPSSLARELNFVASHAIHHYAIIRPLALAAGVELPTEFGKAPETVRHEKLQWAT